jgi:hypothetical protein
MQKSYNINPFGALPYADAYWVVPEKLMAGEYPGTPGEENTRKRIQGLLRIGVRTFIDLTQPGDSYHPYSKLLFAEADEYGIDVSWKNYSIPDLGVPSIPMVKAILDEIDRAMAEQKTTYIHCLAGIGRTGTIVGCYLVRHGHPVNNVIPFIAALRKDLPTWWCASPEVPEQVDFILNWKEGK